MAAPKPPYDPVKTVEGMFNGSVTRIAYAMKDPLNYAQSTKAVLAETAKKFQDALDDCEIQILEAKWYLEHQLALNKARREAKAREDSAAHAKRKHEEIKDEQEKTVESERENAPKRVKTAEPEESVQTQRPPQPPLQPQPPVALANATNSTNTSKAVPKTGEKPRVSVTTDVKTSQPTPAPPSKPQAKLARPTQIPESTVAPITAEEHPKMTPQDMSAGGNEDFNFVSMFGEASGDNLDGAGNGMNFDLNLGNGFDAEAAAHNLNVHDSSLNSLLPGLESYANQAGDDNSFNMGGNVDMSTGGGADMGAGMTTDNNVQQQININDFSLPSLGPNEFDDLLNSNDMNFDGSLDLNDDGMMNMENMDMDFDSMFK
ncbi:hypothetical protein A1O3_04943 [Capronia epimyces CBS 606.96]|uniref:Uncharacterized protein n=1 Tax=Capronia epimyces CBS 606.96 TaxID=1182542 RepID=W9Y4X5_9EURO|nr:uncharacterized protein A1O3_04943 [Capronia epimyces CBS 606.96]EXJ84276.1 hypothetical protein A1O3_04943 [Capronia epimyces CBS 606.96]